MRRSLLSSQRAFALALALTFASALLPGSALGWTQFFSEILNLPVAPFADALNRAGDWLRPPRLGQIPDSITAEYLDHLKAQASEFERLYLAEHAKVDSLEDQLEQLQGFPIPRGHSQIKTLLAHIALRSPSSAYGAVVLNVGSRHGVVTGAVAVHDHVQLIGRVTEVSAMQCTLLPIVNKTAGQLRGAVLPKDHTTATASLASLPKLFLEPKGDGTLFYSIDKSEIVNVGDEVVLMAEDWPESAQGMKIGVVQSVQTDDTKPLRNLVVVLPALLPSQISTVVLRIENDASATGGSGGSQ